MSVTELHPSTAPLLTSMHDKKKKKKNTVKYKQQNFRNMFTNRRINNNAYKSHEHLAYN